MKPPRSTLGNLVRQSQPTATAERTNVVETRAAAAASTIDALMYSLRKGIVALSRDDVQQRLVALDEQQMRDVCAQLLKRNSDVTKSWKPDEIEHLVIAWAACHG